MPDRSSSLLTLYSLDILLKLDDIRRASCPATDSGEPSLTHQHHCPLRVTRSLNSSPTVKFKMGIPLGSLTAQLASKSFWNKDMLKRSMEQISQCAAQELEVPCFSSLESFHDSEDEMEYSDRDLIQVSEEECIMDSAQDRVEPEQVRELKNPYTVFSERQYKRCETPPYLSPGITRRVFINITESWYSTSDNLSCSCCMWQSLRFHNNFYESILVQSVKNLV